MPKISSIKCHRILNSCGSWTIETHVRLDDGSVGVQAVPINLYKNDNEVVFLPVNKAIEVVETVLSEALVGKDPFDQHALDSLMISLDGTKNKKNLGGNSILSVSLAISRAAAKARGLQLYEYLSLIYSGQLKPKNQLIYPTPIFSVLNGGKYASNGLSFEEFMIIPSRKVSYEYALDIGMSLYQMLRKVLITKGIAVSTDDQGGFTPADLTPSKALQILRHSVIQKYKPGEDVFFGIDVAARSFYKDGSYIIFEEKLKVSSAKLHSYYSNLVKNFELLYIEDPFFERDSNGWQDFYKTYGKKLLIVADELVCTNVGLLRKSITDNQANAVIVKPSQIGTLSETLAFIRMAKAANMAVILSHTSGETAEDTFIADLAIGVEADFIKAGAPVRGEHVVKYNRILEIIKS